MKIHALLLTCGVVLALVMVSPTAEHSAAAEPADPIQLFLPAVVYNYCGHFFDTFDNTETDWFTGQLGALNASVINGEYRLTFTGAGSVWLMPGPMCGRSNYEAAVDVRWNGRPGNFIGILLDVDDTSHKAYLFAVNTDDRVWLVFETRKNALTTVIAPVFNDAIRPGNETNRLAAERAGETIRLFINDAPVGELRSAPPPQTVLAGVAAASYTTQSAADARFDNFHFDGPD